MTQSAKDHFDFSRLSDADLLQKIADEQAMINALLAEISRRLGHQTLETPTPVDAAQESADKNKLWGGVIKQDAQGKVID